MTTHDETQHPPAVVEPAKAPAVTQNERRTPALTQEMAQQAVTGEAGPPPADRRERRTRRTALIVVVATAVAAAAGLAATGAFSGDDGSAARAAPGRPAATVKVQRLTLTSTETVDATLGHGEPAAVTDASSASVPSAASASGTGGTGGDGPPGADGEFVTWVPREGDTLGRGDAVYRVNEREVPLLYGSIPFYRTLKPGSQGADVRLLERNLAELGYSGFTADDEYTSGTAAAVEEWQDDLNAEETGTVRPGDAVVAPGARRVAELKTSPGAVAGGEVLTWTGTERIVSMDLDPRHEALVKEGLRVTVRLPDGGTVVGEVTDIGTVGNDNAGSGSGAGAGSESRGADEATLPVRLKIGDQKKLGRYQAASVDVILEAGSRENVLAVPVNALMARPGGGYAVEVPAAGGGQDMVPVELGTFAGGLVEVKGPGIKEGMDVGVPK
ncbi:peptidoglycan-binding domain-containing protein [Streptomyces sp. 35G-GA-8]|uniref:peptidoglycan-binding protein n=1 Tax=Streptomyces sp. 35G-GA-8 TaxID=2939434 RepID=UPI00201FB20D|nr:peptidoglycan-binding domain-containing protein [Streptomyces sp. 35G-GA-8]MCL7379810.1 peptidoglycan-binding protein [Streptomyces sp. 35G-GA-8]